MHNFVHLSGVHHSSDDQGRMQSCTALEYLAIKNHNSSQGHKKEFLLCLAAKQFLLREQEYRNYNSILASTGKPYPGLMEHCARLLRVSFSLRELLSIGVSGRQKHEEATEEK